MNRFASKIFLARKLFQTYNLFNFLHNYAKLKFTKHRSSSGKQQKMIETFSMNNNSSKVIHGRTRTSA